MSDSYNDIIGLPHHVSQTRPQMSRRNRAAKFAPFAALTGYDVTVTVAPVGRVKTFPVSSAAAGAPS